MTSHTQAIRRTWPILCTITLLLVLTACASRGERTRQEKVLDDMAKAINASAGQLVSYTHAGGGLDGPRTLGIITLRRGDEATVAKAQIDAATAAGYQDPPAPPYSGRGGGYGFGGPSTLPMLSIETFAENTTTRLGGHIPPGMTEVIITLGYGMT